MNRPAKKAAKRNRPTGRRADGSRDPLTPCPSPAGRERGESTPEPRGALGPLGESGAPAAEADALLVERCLAGEAGGWEELYLLCQKPLVATIRRVLGHRAADANTVDEIAARVWYALIKNDAALLKRFDAARQVKLTDFLMGLARIESLAYLRAEGRRRAHEGNVQTAAFRPEDVVYFGLRDFMATLNDSDRSFVLRYLVTRPGGAADESAPAISATNLWQRRHRLRVKLQDYLNDRGGAEKKGRFCQDRPTRSG